MTRSNTLRGLLSFFASIALLAGVADAVPFTFNDLNPAQLPGLISSTSTFDYEITNNTGQSWTDFRFRIGAFPGPPVIFCASPYPDGPGTPTVSQDGNGRDTILDVTGLSVAQGQVYDLSLCAVAIEGMGVFTGQPNLNAGTAGEAYYSVRGDFSDGADVAKFFLSTDQVGTTEPMEFATWHHSGATNAAGESIPAGGFDPTLGFRKTSSAVIQVFDDDDGPGRDAWIMRSELGDPNPGDALPADIYAVHLEAFGDALAGRDPNWAVDLIGPGDANTDLFALSGDGNIHFTSIKYGTTGSGPSSRAKLSVGSTVPTSDLTLQGDLTAGVTGGADLRVQSGATLTTWGDSLLADATGSEVAAEVTGGSQWRHGGRIIVANKGTATLDVKGAGVVTSQSLDGSFGFIGLGSGGDGTVTIDGSGSRWSGLRELFVGGDGAGAGGTGELVVKNGGQVDVIEALKVWSTGTIKLLGSEINTSSFQIDAGGSFIHEGGTLTVSGGQFDPGVSNYLIDGADASDLPIVRLTDGAQADLAGSVDVGDIQRGRLEVLGGSTVNLINSMLTIGDNAGSDGSVFVAGDGHLTTADAVLVGNIGKGSLEVVEGGKVTTGGIAAIAWRHGSEGSEASVVGDDSEWNVTGELFIGDEDLGVLSVFAGGKVTSGPAYLGRFLPTGNGTAIVAGMGATKWSAWHIDGNLYIGGGTTGPVGTGHLLVTDDAQVVTLGSGDTTVWETGTIELGGGMLSTGQLDLEGQLLGDGAVIIATFDLLNNRGLIAPGVPIGNIVVNGSYVQESSGILSLDIAGTSPAQFDRLDVTATANLAGTLTLSLPGPFVPVFGQSFEIMTAPSGVFGGFEVIDTAGAPLGLSHKGWQLEWLPDYEHAGAVELLTGVRGDMDLDADVDFDDISAFVQGLTDPAGYLASYLHGASALGDFDGDTDLDFDDIDLFVARLIGGAPLHGSLVSVPEPSTGVIGVVALVGLLLGQRPGARG